MTDKPTKTAPDSQGDINAAWHALVEAVVAWQAHMDQWEKFKFATPYGHVYVTISMASDYPDSFDLIDGDTGDVIQPAGVPNDRSD
jgi:hypothetical protein